jgi:hypothetical protein
MQSTSKQTRDRDAPVSLVPALVLITTLVPSSRKLTGKMCGRSLATTPSRPTGWVARRAQHSPSRQPPLKGPVHLAAGRRLRHREDAGDEPFQRKRRLSQGL